MKTNKMHTYNTKKIFALLFSLSLIFLFSFTGCTNTSGEQPLATIYKYTTLSNFKLNKSEYTVEQVKKEFLTSDFVTTKFYCKNADGKEFEIVKIKDDLIDNYINIKATETATSAMQKEFNNNLDNNIKILCDCRVLDDPAYGYSINDSSFYNNYEENLEISPYYYMWGNCDVINIYIFYNKDINNNINYLYNNSIDIVDNCYNEFIEDVSLYGNNKTEGLFDFIQYYYLIEVNDSFDVNTVTGNEVDEIVSSYSFGGSEKHNAFTSIHSFYTASENGSIVFSELNQIK